MIPTAWTYPAREPYKSAYFLWFYNLTPTLFMTDFLKHNFDAILQKMYDATVHNIPLHWYKLNWPIPCDIPESWIVLSGAFLFLSGICALGHLLGKGWPLGSRLWCLAMSLLLSHWYPGSDVVLDCIYSWSLHPYLLWTSQRHYDVKLLTLLLSYIIILYYTWLCNMYKIRVFETLYGPFVCYTCNI